MRSFFRFVPTLLLGLGLAAAVAPVAAIAEYSVRTCVGQIKCPVPYEAFFQCGTTIDQAAEALCTIVTDGVKTTVPYRIEPGGNHEGDGCGYVWFNVVCMN